MAVLKQRKPENDACPALNVLGQSAAATITAAYSRDAWLSRERSEDTLAAGENS